MSICLQYNLKVNCIQSNNCTITITSWYSWQMLLNPTENTCFKVLPMYIVQCEGAFMSSLKVIGQTHFYDSSLFIAQFWFSCVWGFSLSFAYKIYAKGTDEEALMSFEIYLPMYLPSCLTSTQKSLSKAYRWLYCTAYRETQKIIGLK